LDRREDIEPNEIFYDYVAKHQEESQDIAEKKFEISLSKNSLLFPFAIASVFFWWRWRELSSCSFFPGRIT